MGTNTTVARRDSERLAIRFRPIFDEIAEGAAARDRNRRLPYDEVERLKREGFGTVLVPEDEGGVGGGYDDLTRLLVDLAAADPNIAQAFRGHFHTVHDIVTHEPGAFRDRWLREILAGKLFSNGVTDTPGTPLGKSSAVIHRDTTPPTLSGQKDYSTGSLFSEWIIVLDKTGTAPERVFVPTGHPGVRRDDSWNGFGQRLTSTGSSVFENVPLEPWQFAPPVARAPLGDLLQLILLATVAGIGRRVTSDLVALVRARRRVYAHGAAPAVQDDPQVLQAVGEVSAATTTAETIVIDLGKRHEELYHLASKNPDPAELASAHDATVAAVYQAQTIVPRLVLDAATRAFDALGASATDLDLGLDRHWRNARTIASHNPIIYRSRIVGDWLVNGRLDTFWTVGAAPRRLGDSA